MGEKTKIKNADVLKEYLKQSKKRKVKFTEFAKKYKKKKK